MRTQLNDEVATKRARPAAWIWRVLLSVAALAVLWLLFRQHWVLLARHVSGGQGFAMVVIVAAPGLLVVSQGLHALVESTLAQPGVSQQCRKHDESRRKEQP